MCTLRSLLRPIIAVGVKANDRKWESGNQNQNWVKTSRPTTDGMWVWPVLDCREMVTLRPPGRKKAGKLEGFPDNNNNGRKPYSLLRLKWRKVSINVIFMSPFFHESWVLVKIRYKPFFISTRVFPLTWKTSIWSLQFNSLITIQSSPDDLQPEFISAENFIVLLSLLHCQQVLAHCESYWISLYNIIRSWDNNVCYDSALYN